MKTKLTLSIDDDVVRRARRLSKKQRKSVSVLFEEFIHQQDKMRSHQAADSVVDQLTGILNDPGISYGEMKEEYRKSKLNKKKHA